MKPCYVYQNKLSKYLILLFVLLIAIPWIILSCQLFEETKQEYLKQLSCNRPIEGHGGCGMMYIPESEVIKPINKLKKRIIFSNLLEGTVVLLAVGVIGKKILTTEKELRTLASTDGLTGVSSRLLFMELLKMELVRFQRHTHAACLLMVDIDYFKAINDSYGHCAGDNVLKHFTGLVENNLRNFDIFGRFGGEEFCILLPATEVDGGQQFAERLCQIIASTPMENNNESISYSVSIGVTPFLPGDNEIIEIIDRADAALYQAKTAGRNRAISSLMPHLKDSRLHRVTAIKLRL